MARNEKISSELVGVVVNLMFWDTEEDWFNLTLTLTYLTLTLTLTLTDERGIHDSLKKTNRHKRRPVWDTYRGIQISRISA